MTCTTLLFSAVSVVNCLFTSVKFETVSVCTRLKNEMGGFLTENEKLSQHFKKSSFHERKTEVDFSFSIYCNILLNMYFNKYFNKYNKICQEYQ